METLELPVAEELEDTLAWSAPPPGELRANRQSTLLLSNCGEKPAHSTLRRKKMQRRRTKAIAPRP